MEWYKILAMGQKTQSTHITEDGGLYDSAPADLWFLPDADADADKPGLSPLPRANTAPLIDPGLWRAAEAANAAELARTTGLFAALDERLRHGPKGWQHRLALLEVVEISWQIGDRLQADQIALWAALRLTGAGEQTQALARASWCLRRLTSGAGPEAGALAFLGRQISDDDLDAPEHRLADWSLMMRDVADLHPITKAAFARLLWQIAGAPAEALVDHSPTQLMEAIVMAARIGADEARGGAIFLPVALGATPSIGSAQARLLAWLKVVRQGCQTALLHLDRIAAWQSRAETAMAGLSGATPPKLREVLVSWPLVSAPVAEAETGASRAAVQRNLRWMEENGLIREVTGQGRYRFWTAKL